MHLTDENIDTVSGWINTRTWPKSRDYFRDHVDQLLADHTLTALDEVALTAPEGLIGQFRGLLEAVRENGLEAAYQPMLLAETFREWVASPSRDSSRTFLHDHPELLAEETPGLLARLRDNPDPAIIVHRAVLTLARTPAGIDSAYQNLKDEQSLRATISEAIAARDAAQIEASAQIETFVLGRAFTGALHFILAWLLTGSAQSLPDGWASEIRGLMAQADAAEQDSALPEFNAALASIPADNIVVGQLRHILGIPDAP
jgi:hypothetical protein